MAHKKGSSKHKQEKYKAHFAITEANKKKKQEKIAKRLEQIKSRKASS